MEEQIFNIINEMSDCLNILQLKKLQESLLKNLSNTPTQSISIDNDDYLYLFLMPNVLRAALKEQFNIMKVQ